MIVAISVAKWHKKLKYVERCLHMSKIIIIFARKIDKVYDRA